VLTRRHFLRASLAAAGAGAVCGAKAGLPAEAPDGGKAGANDRLRVAVLGVRGQGRVHVSRWTSLKDVEVAAICDPDENVIHDAMTTAEKKGGKKPAYFKDLRKLLEDKSIDAVSVATPNHWHVLASIWAVQAGKDVYVEKPLGHNVWEQRRLVEASRKYDRLVQMGNYPRSNANLRAGIEYLRSGKLGRVRLARAVWYSGRGSIGKKPDGPVPPGVDYDLWLGPAPERPYNPNRFHYNWHWNWDYGGGEIANNGIYLLDTARWGLGRSEHPRGVLSFGGRFGYEDDGQTPNTQIAAYDYGDVQILLEVRGLRTDKFRDLGIGTFFEGEKGTLISGGGAVAAYGPDGQVLEKFTGGGDHFRNFADAVKARKREDLTSEVAEGHLSTSLCHLANISYRLGEPRSLEAEEPFGANAEANDMYRRFRAHLGQHGLDPSKAKACFGRRLAFDPASERFVGDPDADALLSRAYRKPFAVPEQV
jgi:predicted dehydrogenase